MSVVEKYSNVEDVHWWTHVWYEIAYCVWESDLGEDQWVGCEKKNYVEYCWTVYCVCSDVEDEKEGYVADEKFSTGEKLGITN